MSRVYDPNVHVYVGEIIFNLQIKQCFKRCSEFVFCISCAFFSTDNRQV